MAQARQFDGFLDARNLQVPCRDSIAITLRAYVALGEGLISGHAGD